MKDMSTKPLMRCSFCGQSQKEVKRLIAGPKVCICDGCVDTAQEQLRNLETIDAKASKSGMPIPREIREFLDTYVVGQERAKRVLAVAVYNHYRRLAHSTIGSDIELTKSNILLIGPTGSGKTLFAQALARALDVPFVICDATSLTSSGYVGEDVDSIVTKLLQEADYDVEKAQKGIIYIDEIDKIALKGDGPSITRDVSGEGVQQGLLKIIEGTVCNVRYQPGRKNPNEQTIPVDTRNILFICGGAFAGLDKLVSSRLETKSIGFGANVDVKTAKQNPGDLFKKIQVSDLVRFGMIPEFIGRLPIIATLDDLDESMLIDILTKPKNALVRQYQTMFDGEGISLDFEVEALSAIAKLAIERKTGARGLRAMLEDLLLDTMYELPEMSGIKSVVIDGDVVKNGKSPIRVPKPENDDEDTAEVAA